MSLWYWKWVWLHARSHYTQSTSQVWVRGTNVIVSEHLPSQGDTLEHHHILCCFCYVVSVHLVVSHYTSYSFCSVWGSLNRCLDCGNGLPLRIIMMEVTLFRYSLNFSLYSFIVFDIMGIYEINEYKYILCNIFSLQATILY